MKKCLLFFALLLGPCLIAQTSRPGTGVQHPTPPDPCGDFIGQDYFDCIYAMYSATGGSESGPDPCAGTCGDSSCGRQICGGQNHQVTKLGRNVVGRTGDYINYECLWSGSNNTPGGYLPPEAVGWCVRDGMHSHTASSYSPVPRS